jgi:hypothetical protein
LRFSRWREDNRKGFFHHSLFPKLINQSKITIKLCDVKGKQKKEIFMADDTKTTLMELEK